MKAEVDKLNINKLVNVGTVSHNLKTKLEDSLDSKLDIDNLKNVPVDLKKVSDVMSKEIVKKELHNKLNTKASNLKQKQNS